MYRINGYDIELTRGDSLTLRVLLSGRDLPVGTDAVFTLKSKPRESAYLLQKRFDASDEQVVITLAPDETNLTPGTYYWDLRLQIPLDTGGYEVYTPMEYAAFTILDAIGTSIGTGQSEAMNPDLPVLQVVLSQAREVLASAQSAALAIGGMTVEAVESQTASASICEVDGHKHIVFGVVRGPEGQRGPQGEPGVGLRILGTYANADALATQVTSPAQGDMYQVGVSDPYIIWMWDAAQGWLSLGQLHGVRGVSFTPFVSTSGDLSWTNDGGLTNPESVNLKGPQGDPGPQGEPGPQGDPGPAGEKGGNGADGYTPVRGVDYWTDADKEEVVSEVLAAAGGGSYTVLLPASAWSAQDDGTYVQLASLPGVQAENKAIVDVDMSAATAGTYAALLEAWLLIGRAYTVGGGIVFVCYDGAPETDLSINVEVL